MTDRRILTLSPRSRPLAHQGIEAAPDGWILELRAPRRNDAQNRALWSALSEIQRQRPKHNGVKMTPEFWKAVFLDALGAEVSLMPKLDGDGYFPLGHRSSVLTKGQFSDLLTLITAWCAREGIELDKFDDGQEPERAQEAARVAV